MLLTSEDIIRPEISAEINYWRNYPPYITPSNNNLMAKIWL